MSSDGTSLALGDVSCEADALPLPPWTIDPHSAIVTSDISPINLANEAGTKTAVSSYIKYQFHYIRHTDPHCFPLEARSNIRWKLTQLNTAPSDRASSGEKEKR